MIRFRLLSTLCTAPYFLEASLGAGNWNPAVVVFFTVSLPHFPTRLRTHFPSTLSHTYLSTQISHQNPPIPPSACVPPAFQPCSLLLLNQFVIFRISECRACVQWWCVSDEEPLRKNILQTVDRQMLSEGWFLWFSGWPIRAALNIILFPPSTLTSYWAMFQ